MNGCTQCNMLSIQGMPCHETGCPIGPSVATCTCGEQLTRGRVWYANDWDGIKLCRDCAERQAEYEAELEQGDDE